MKNQRLTLIGTGGLCVLVLLAGLVVNLIPAANGWHGWPADAPSPAIAPFNAEQAQERQAAWSRYLKIDVEFTNSLGMKFILIPPGEFVMGSTEAEIDAALMQIDPSDQQYRVCVESEAPRHTVILTQPIYISAHEVTQGQYARVMTKKPSYFGKAVISNRDTRRHPVETVSWFDAREFCAKLSEKEKRKPLYFHLGELGETAQAASFLNANSYRLPTEAEWEFACRAGTTTRFWIGENDTDLLRAGWFSANAGASTHPVGELTPNPFGLFDTHGNVWEWCQDGWQPASYRKFEEKPGIDPIIPSVAGSPRVIRGGNWGLAASLCRAAHRSIPSPASRNISVGFRVVLAGVASR